MCCGGEYLPSRKREGDALLNEGPFAIRKQGFGGEDEDRYGRLLRVLSRDGESLGEVLVREGYAKRWKGWRGDWC